jgi:prepilin-type N-terminal cleavage/methylation domain-containing protein
MKGHKQKAFTLLEVIITVGILSTMTIAAVSLLKSSLEMRKALSEKGVFAHRINTVMRILAKDIEHGWLLSTMVDQAQGRVRGTEPRSIFQFGSTLDGLLQLTAASHTPLLVDAKESDISFVSYELKESTRYPGRTALFRGAAPRVPDNFRDQLKMDLLADSIKEVKIQAWTGDGFVSEWSSQKSDTRDKLPQMIQLTVIAWNEIPEEGQEDVALQGGDSFLTSFTTSVFLPYSSRLKELKSRSKSVNF